MAEEKNYEKKIRQYMTDKGSWVLKTFSNGIQRTGIPDLLICYQGRFMGLEVKASNGTPTSLQLWNLSEITKNGGLAYIICPPDGIERLKRLVSDSDFKNIEVIDLDGLKTVIDGLN